MARTDAWEERRRTFERTAEAYDRYRPGYPDAVFADVRDYADLAPDDPILEIGCGTGRATLPLARWGNPVLAIDAAPAMVEVARARLRDHPAVEIECARFEEAGLPLGSFGLVACAQAYHWLEEATRVERIARSLYAHGAAAIIANVQVTPADHLAFWRRVDEVYRREAPGLAHKGSFREPGDLPPHPFGGSDLFGDLEQSAHPWQWTLTARDYIGLLGTHSPHAALDPRARERLTAAIVRLISDEFDGEVTEHYVAMASLARRA